MTRISIYSEIKKDKEWVMAIAPHPDDELVGFGSKLGTCGLVVFVTNANDGRVTQATSLCKDLGIPYIFLNYPDGKLIYMTEDERYNLIKTIEEIGSKYERRLIPSPIDRNFDHTVLGGRLAPVAPIGSMYYSYTDTLPMKRDVQDKVTEYCTDKEIILKKYYPQEYRILKDKGLVQPKCFYQYI